MCLLIYFSLSCTKRFLFALRRLEEKMGIELLFSQLNLSVCLSACPIAICGGGGGGESLPLDRSAQISLWLSKKQGGFRKESQLVQGRQGAPLVWDP